MPLRVKQIIRAEKLHKNDYAMECNREIPSTDNTLKIITICSGLYKYYGSTYYNDREDAFRCILGEYIKPSLKDIDHPEIIE